MTREGGSCQRIVSQLNAVYHIKRFNAPPNVEPTRRLCRKQYVGSTITSFRYRFNNHKSSLARFGRGQRGICGEHLYSHFFSKGHSGLTDVSVPIIDKTDIGDPTTREGFWTHKLKCFTPLGLNIMDI